MRGVRTATNCSGLGMSALSPTTGVKTGKAQYQQMLFRFCPRKRTSDLRVNEYISRSASRRELSSARSTARRSARTISSGADLSGIPMPRMLTDKAAQADSQQRQEAGEQSRPRGRALRDQARRRDRRRHRRTRTRRAGKSVAARRIPHQGGQAMRLPKYVQAWVDREGRAHHYLRRKGFPLARLPGLPWSPSFMAAYEKAM